MKVTNLTDVETPTLKQHGLVGQTFAVGRALLGPGESAEVPEEYARMLGSGLEHLVNAGACAVGELPASYQAAKAAVVAKAHTATPPPQVKEGGGGEAAVSTAKKAAG